MTALNPDLGRAHHLGPLLGFRGNEFAEIGWRERKFSASFAGKPRLYFGIGESGVDFPVEPVDNLGGRIAGRSDAEPGTRLVTRHEFAQSRYLGQGLRARCAGYRQRTQLASLGVFDSAG